MPRDSVKIGLLGMGTVGGGVAALLARSDGLLMERTDIDFVIKRVLVRDPSRKRAVELPPSVFTTGRGCARRSGDRRGGADRGLNRHAPITAALQRANTWSPPTRI